MSKVKDFFLNIKVKIKDKMLEVKNYEDQKKNKIAKILSFVVGAVFSFCGVIAVAIWKYLFCNKEENSKYCIRLSAFGMIVRWIVCIKLFSSSFSPLFIDDNYSYVKLNPFNKIVVKDGSDVIKVGANGIEVKSKNKNSKELKNRKMKPFFADDDIIIDGFIQPMFIDFAKMQQQMQNEFNTMHEQIEKSFVKMQKEFAEVGKNATNKGDKVKTKTITKKDGTTEETTLVEIPNGYKKVVKTTYSANNKTIKNKENKK